MLNSLRKSAGSWVVKGLLLLLVASFAAWGIGDYLTRPPSQVIAKVGDAEIQAADFRQQLDREIQRMQQQFGVTLSTEQIRLLGIVDLTLQRLLTREILRQAADDLGVRVSDKVIADDIRANPAFHNAEGAFDRQRFEQILFGSGLSEAAFVALTRRDIAREQVVSSVTAGAQSVPKSVADLVYGYRNEKRVADYAVIRNDAMTGIPAPTEEELAAYHKDSAERFTAPEYRSLTLVTLQPEDFIGEIQVDDAAIAAEYEARRSEFVTPERRAVQQMLFDGQEKAKAAADKIKSGADFAAVAKETLNLSEADIDLGEVAKADLPPALADPVFALAEGEASGVVESPLGWHILRVTKVTPGTTKTLDDVRAQLSRDIALVKAGDNLFGIGNELEDALAGGASLEEAASGQGLEARKIDQVDASGLTPDGKKVEGLPAGAAFMGDVFSAEIGADPLLKDLPEGGYYLFRVDDIREPALRPLEEVREQVVAAWTAEQRRRTAEKAAAELAGKINSGEALADLAAAAGLDIQTSEAMLRSGQDGVMSGKLKGLLFAAKTGEAVTAATAEGNGYVVALLRDIQAAAPAADAARVDELAAQMAAGIAGDLAGQYQNALQQRLGVEVNKALIEATLGS